MDDVTPPKLQAVALVAQKRPWRGLKMERDDEGTVEDETRPNSHSGSLVRGLLILPPASTDKSRCLEDDIVLARDLV